MYLEFEKVFSFVKNEALRGHMSDALFSSVEFSTVALQYPEPARSLFYKTAIIQLASIIEACLHYALIELKFQYYRTDWQYLEIRVLYPLEDENVTEIIAGKRQKKKVSIDGYVDFAVLNRFCKNKAKLYNDDLYEEINDVRKLRNKVHLISLSEIDKIYSRKEVDRVAEITNKVLDIVEVKLK